MTWLESIIGLLFMVSAKLGESTTEAAHSPAKTICIAIVVLLDVASNVNESYDALVNLFERIQFFLQRLNAYSEIPYSARMKGLLWDIMSEMLSILAVFTKAMKETPMKKIVRGLVGRSHLEDVPQRLNELINEETLIEETGNLEITQLDDGGEVATGVLIRGGNDALNVIQEQMDSVAGNEVDSNSKAQVPPNGTFANRQDGSVHAEREKLRQWLNPPDPSKNHNLACKARYGGSAVWYLQSKTFRSWKKNGSLLWIRGKPGSGKSVFSSAIIEDIKNSREAKSDLIAYYYFDANDVAKRDVQGLLASLVMQLQLGDDSHRCLALLYRLYTSCRHGSVQPSEAALTRCLKNMIVLQEQLDQSVYVIIDGVDNCPNPTGTVSARKKVLELVEDLDRSRYSNLHLCITSSPEQDIKTILNLLIPSSRRVTLHKADGQKEDIKNYIRSFIQRDQKMQKWTADEKKLVVDTLSERADGIFRWVSLRLDALHENILDLIRNTPDELGTSLDETFQLTLQGIPKEKSQHAIFLFQCLVAAIRPLQLTELVEIFATECDPNPAPNEEAVLPGYLTPIAVVDEKTSKIVDFSTPLAKEFLSSDRLRTLDNINISSYHIPLESAHTVMARACLKVLLQLDDKEDHPLAPYAAQHWVAHAKFGNVASQVEGNIERLFDPKGKHFEAWLSISNIDKGNNKTTHDLALQLAQRPNPLYYAALCGFSELANYLVTTCAEPVNVKYGSQGSPLHAASYRGHLDVARVLIDHGADVNTTNEDKRSPLHVAFYGGQLKVMELLLQKGADVDVRDSFGNTLLHRASFDGRLEVVSLLLNHNANSNAKNQNGWRPLHRAALREQVEVARLLLRKEAEVNTQTLDGNTPLHIASIVGTVKVAELLLLHGADVHARGEHDWTPIHTAKANGHSDIERLLLRNGAKD
ncbi:hypothetical protein BJV74DRAFT_821797 [Russula compacta]|nr:hypothetical protein BJV74DRAFT_821797 [Russula compacta]